MTCYMKFMIKTQLLKKNKIDHAYIAMIKKSIVRNKKPFQAIENVTEKMFYHVLVIIGIIFIINLWKFFL